MLQFDKRCFKLLTLVAFICICASQNVDARRSNANLTACQHLRRAETRRAKALSTLAPSNSIRIPRCTKKGAFEEVQCLNERSGENCWCVDEYGIEVPGTRSTQRSSVNCAEPANCPASACRMFCPAGFARDAENGCTICRCRDPCQGVECPNGQACQLQEVACKSEPCPPVPTCKKARSISNYCPAGLPLAIDGSQRPFLCGLDAGKPECPPLYQCLVENGNDYGVCCPKAIQFKKPGVCPATDTSHYTESTGYMCGSPCSHDLECPNMEKCCFTKGCQYNCQHPHNVTACHQARALVDILAINEREGRGYVPECDGPYGLFSPRQCSRNGLVCWCVNPRTGHKILGSMGAASSVDCDGWENMVGRSIGRSFNMEKCDTNICAAVCEYGFKNDHNGCPTCECSEPCEGFKCSSGSHCEVATDPLCESGSNLCASWPVCKPDLVYSNPCDIGTPLSSNQTGEVLYCFEERQSRAFQPTAFFEPGPEEKQSRAMTNRIICPDQYKCTKLHRQTESVCCPLAEQDKGSQGSQEPQERQQTMCEYLRDFSERMEGTEEGMQLAIPAPRCTADGAYNERQCTLRKIIVTRADQRKILEENTIRRMRMLLSSISSPAPRTKRETERLKLYRVDDSALKVSLAAPVMGRSAKVIDMGADRERQQGLGQLFETNFKKVAPAPKEPTHKNDLVEMEVEECWCVDSFGSEIPRTRGYNVSDATCTRIREEVECLDLTCRMGCEYGFNLDPDTRCPACQCRDPCEGVTCGDGKECRIVDVSCDEEYCPPVPACLPRKPGQCPFLVPPGPDNLDTNVCSYECRTDSHCDGTKRCCSNGCGTQCVEPQMKTACQHLQAIQMHQSSELGIRAMRMYIAQCDLETGVWNATQCSPDGYCWCVDVSNGQELSGTRVKGVSPVCEVNSAFQCARPKCNDNCDVGYKVDENGCQTCECRNFCDELSCHSNEECKLIGVECINGPCPKMPICVPRRESVCPEGIPYKQGDLEVSCGPQNENEVCPTTHNCQLDPVTHRGVCCTKTRDVCFESLDDACLAKSTSERNLTRYRFSPRVNKCIAVHIDADNSICQAKNLFHSELACNSVCPVLTQCERLKLKNSLAAQRTGHSSAWFKPRCDPVTGHWSPVQCLGKQSSATSTTSQNPILDAVSGYGVCWCADKKGAPLKGTLTRDVEPSCNSRQGRQRKTLEETDPLMEELITQMTMLNEIDDFFTEEEHERAQQLQRLVEAKDAFKLAAESSTTVAAITSTSDDSLVLTNSLLNSQLSVTPELQPLKVEITRCHALAKTASFQVSCDENGAFLPTQCNDKQCWCVDAAGNQLDSSTMFPYGAGKCQHTPIGAVAIELHLQNTSEHSVRNVYDTIRMELQQLLGDKVENLRVQENFDGTAIVRFELHGDDKIDLAFAIESAIAAGKLQLANAHFQPDITCSHFVHRIVNPPVAQAITATESSILLMLFLLATCSAILIIVFVIHVMLKRGRRKQLDNYGFPVYASGKKKNIGKGDKPVDFDAPIFVLYSQQDTTDSTTEPNINA